MFRVRSAVARLAGLILAAGTLASSAPAEPPEIPVLPPRNNLAAPAGVVPAAAPAAGAQPLPDSLPPPRPLALPDVKGDSVPPGDHPPGKVTTIELASALKLAGVESPQILIARQRVMEVVALRQLAAAQILPTLNLGLNYDAHTGPLMQSSGNILDVNRSALYMGMGANAVAAGTVSIPGLVYNMNVADAVFTALIAKQRVAQSRFTSLAVRNEVFRSVATAYTELLRTEGRRSIAFQTRDEAAEVARITSVFAKAGQVAQADADRAATELDRRASDLAQAETEVLIASARLAELLGLDQATRLHPIEDKVVPMPLVNDSIPLCNLLVMAMGQRPELAAQQSAIRQALMALAGAKLLPFSPNVILGFSAGTFGGGSGLVAGVTNPRFGAAPLQSSFGNFGQRNDLDAIAYWTLQNLGVGNAALIKTARANVGIAELEKLTVLNQVRREVADAYVRTQVRFGQIATAELGVRTGAIAFEEDFRRILGGVGRPIELLESLRLLALSRNAYLDAIADYDEAQIDLYVALGQPPADMLARAVPTDFRAPLPQAEGKMPR